MLLFKISQNNIQIQFLPFYYQFISELVMNSRLNKLFSANGMSIKTRHLEVNESSDRISFIKTSL